MIAVTNYSLMGEIEVTSPHFSSTLNVTKCRNASSTEAKSILLLVLAVSVAAYWEHNQSIA